MEPTYTVDEEGTGDKLKNNLIELIEFVAIVFAILMAIRVFAAEPHRVDGSSMIPNFHTGDMIITNKLAARFSDFKRGEVVVLQDPMDATKVFIKRIIGLPGETLKLADGKIYIKGQLLDEPYLPSGLLTPGESFLKSGDEVVIPEGNYFLIGDNRSNSSDSREWGFLKKELIIGQALLRYWPINQAAILSIGVKSN